MAASMKNYCLHFGSRYFRGFCNAFLSNSYSTATFSHALVYDRYGDPISVLKLEERKLEDIGSDEVLVQMIAAPINPADINTIQGHYPIKPSLPAVAGFEGVGKVQEVGSDVTNLKHGDLVISNTSCFGSWRTHLVCKSTDVQSFPEGTPMLFAASLRVNMCTAYRMLTDFEDLQPGDSVIQNAANSGAGQAAIQIAANRGLKTINIVRDRPELDNLRSYLHSLGATVVTTEAELRQNEKSILKDVAKPKLALNAVGGKSCFTLLKHLQPHGTMVTYGGMSKQPVMVPTSSLIFSDVKVKGYWMSRWHSENSEKANAMVEELCSWARAGKMQLPRHRLHSIQDYQTAIEGAMQESQTEKQILRLDGVEE